MRVLKVGIEPLKKARKGFGVFSYLYNPYENKRLYTISVNYLQNRIYNLKAALS